MTDDERGDRQVPALDFALVRAVAPVGREHGLHEAAEAMLRWGVAMMRVLDGPHDTAERLESYRAECMAEHRQLGRAEARRRGEAQ